MNLDEVMTFEEAASAKQVSLDAIYKAVRRGDLATTKVLRKTVLVKSGVDAWQPNPYGDRRQTEPTVAGPFLVVWPFGDMTIVRAQNVAQAEGWAGNHPLHGGYLRIIALSDRTMVELGEVPVTDIATVSGRNPE